MDWCKTDIYAKANHNPVALLNGNESKDIIRISANTGDTITFTSEGSYDPDNNQIKATWQIYKEAGTFPEEVRLTNEIGAITQLIIPKAKFESGSPLNIHIILTITDNGTPNLVSYRRAIISVVK